MKGIILAGGQGSRLYPMTLTASKQLLPIYDKPMIYYPLSTMMLAGVRDILIVTTPEAQPDFETLLGDGHSLGINISYAVQPKPEGIAQAFLLGEEFIGDDCCMLILGDNLVYGQGLSGLLRGAVRDIESDGGAMIFGYSVSDPERYGIIELDDDGKVLSLEEKPLAPKSSIAAIGIYVYDNSIVDRSKSLTPSGRNELEITDVNRLYMHDGSLRCQIMRRGFYWMDSGTPEALHEAASFVHSIQNRVGYLVSSPEEVAFNMGFITSRQLAELSAPLKHTAYGRYLLKIAEEAG